MRKSTNIYESLLIYYIQIIVFINAQFGISYKQPKLECTTEGIRLLFEPIGRFTGHIYVKGFFFSDTCHQNLVSAPRDVPFSMDIPYKGNCAVRRHHSSPGSISYEVTVIIQHHPLFVTVGDRAYRLNCLYRQMNTTVSKKLGVNDIPAVPVQVTTHPTCRYDVSAGSQSSSPLLYANVGDDVNHKWSCDTDLYGFVVHSCVVRNDVGQEYKLIDERGCVLDSSLVPELQYSKDLSIASTTIKAFRFADQIMVHFSCQVTLCRKSENGCEGIAPPTCHPLDLGPIHIEYKTTPSTTANNKIEDETNELAQNEPAFSRTTVTIPVVPKQQSYETTTADWQKVISESLAEVDRDLANKNSVFTEEADNNRLSYSTIALPTQPSTTSTTTSTANMAQMRSQSSGGGGGSGSSKWLNGIEVGKEQYGLEISNIRKNKDGQWVDDNGVIYNDNGLNEDHSVEIADRKSYRTQSLTNTIQSDMARVEGGNEPTPEDDDDETLPFPAAADIYYGSRRPRSHSDQVNITMELDAKQLLVLASESTLPSSEDFKVDAQPAMSTKQMILSQTIFIIVSIIIQMVLISVIFVQRHQYQKSLRRLKEPRELYN